MPYHLFCRLAVVVPVGDIDDGSQGLWCPVEEEGEGLDVEREEGISGFAQTVSASDSETVIALRLEVASHLAILCACQLGGQTQVGPSIRCHTHGCSEVDVYFGASHEYKRGDAGSDGKCRVQRRRWLWVVCCCDSDDGLMRLAEAAEGIGDCHEKRSDIQGHASD